MPSRKKPKILQDKDNLAIRTAGTQAMFKGRAVLFSETEIARIADGIRSLQAERDMLRKLVKEAYMKGALDQSHRCGLAGRAKDWEVSGFPEKIERPWDG